MALLLAAACGGGGTSQSAGPTTSTSVAVSAPRYQAVATVLESPRHGPELCLGGVQISLPPNCGGPALVNWDWAKVQGEQSQAGVTWGEFRVVGTYDGRAFTLTEPAQPAPAPPVSFGGLTTPCNEPHNGFLASDPARATAAHLDTAVQLARTHPNLSGLWIDDPDQPRPDGTVRQGHVVLNVSYTTGLDDRRAELAAVWGGALCVSKAERTLAELQAVQGAVGTSAPAGLEVLSTAVLEHANVVEIRAVVVRPEHQAALDARFGPGTVRAKSALQPLA